MILTILQSRKAVSEVMAAVMTIAITLIAGFALYGYINGQAAASENRIGAAAGGNANFLAEKFVVVQMSFSTCNGFNCAIVYVYNNGQVDLSLKWMHLYNLTSTGGSVPLDITYNSTTTLSGNCKGGTGTMSPGFSFDGRPLSSPSPLSLSIPTGCSFKTGATYYVDILGQYGNNVIYYAVK